MPYCNRIIGWKKTTTKKENPNLLNKCQKGSHGVARCENNAQKSRIYNTINSGFSHFLMDIFQSNTPLYNLLI